MEVIHETKAILLILTLAEEFQKTDIIDQVSTMYHNTGYWPSAFSNDTNIILNTNMISFDINQAKNTHTRRASKPRFKLSISIKLNNNDDVTEIIHVYLVFEVYINPIIELLIGYTLTHLIFVEK